MAIFVPPVSQIGDKWTRRVQGASQDYSAGVANAGNRWQEAVNMAENTYSQGVTQALAEGRYGAGVAGKASKYQRRAAELGPARWTQGVAGGRQEYEAAMQQVSSIIQSVNLVPRGPKGSPQNFQRSAQIGEALHSARIR